MSKVIENHLRHKNKLSEIELKALSIQHYLQYLYPINSANIVKLKLLSK